MTKLTRNHWAQLLNGRIVRIYGVHGETLEYSRAARQFVMTERDGKRVHKLLADISCHRRLAAHWNGFQTARN